MAATACLGRLGAGLSEPASWKPIRPARVVRDRKTREKLSQVGLDGGRQGETPDGRVAVLSSDMPDARFRGVFREHYDAIARYCLRRLPRGEVDDAVARAFAVAWRKVDEMPAGDATLPWLYRIASYEVSTMRRSSRRRVALRAKLTGLGAASQQAPDVQVVQRAEFEAVMAALAALSEADREVILLRSYEGLASEEIATVLGCSPEAARQRLSRALRRLRKVAGFAPAQAQLGRPEPVEGGESA